MARFGFVVAVLAAAAAAWAALEVRSLRQVVETQAQEIADVRGAGFGRAAHPSGAQPKIVVSSDEPAGTPAGTAVGPLPGDGAPTLAASRPEDSASLDAKVAALEERVKANEQAVSSFRRRGEGGPQVAMSMPKFLHDVDSAVRELKLDDGQRADLERIVEDSKRALDDLRSRPNDEGLTWKEVSKFKLEGSADGGMISFGGNFEKMEAFRKSKVPGTNETYGEADQRIRRNAKDSLRRTLTPEQQKTFDGAHSDPLFGGGGFGMVSAVLSTEAVEVGSDDR
jgi:hypothetical protein